MKATTEVVIVLTDDKQGGQVLQVQYPEGFLELRRDKISLSFRLGDEQK